MSNNNRSQHIAELLLWLEANHDDSSFDSSFDGSFDGSSDGSAIRFLLNNPTLCAQALVDGLLSSTSVSFNLDDNDDNENNDDDDDDYGDVDWPTPPIPRVVVVSEATRSVDMSPRCAFVNITKQHSIGELANKRPARAQQVCMDEGRKKARTRN